MVSQTLTRGFAIAPVNPHVRQGRILWMARVGRGLSREKLGDRVGVSRETVRLWETGKRSPDAVMIGRLAIVLQQDVHLFWS